MIQKEIDTILLDKYGYPEAMYIKEAMYNLAKGLARGAYTISERTDDKQLLLILCKELEGEEHEKA